MTRFGVSREVSELLNRSVSVIATGHVCALALRTSCVIKQSKWVTLSFRNTKVLPEVLHQTLNPTAELWCKTLSRIKVNLVLHRT